jgi:hypothetical protein
LQTGWNQIGDPYNAKIAISSLQFSPAGSSSPVFYSTAVSNGLINPVLFSYNGGTGQYVGLGGSDSIIPFQGYWIQVYQPVPLTFTSP